MLRTMTARTSSRAASAASAAASSPVSASKRTLTTTPSRTAQNEDSVFASSSNGSASKRARYAPTPLANGADSVGIGPSTSTYSLRRVTRATSSSSKPPSAVKTEDGEALVDLKPTATSTPSKAVKKETDLFATSPRKTNVKPIKIDLDPSEARPAPKRWEQQYAVLAKQRKRIIAPVDTLGCEENGKDEKRQDLRDTTETPEASARRERFTLLISLMLSSQTKDPVTAEAVHNLQRSLPNGLCLDSILAATQDQISSNINKVGFWRRKTGYIQSTAKILREDFDGDVPKTIDELCSLPGVGPKMGFLALQGAWGLNIGIGVDVHVHRVANRLKWVNSTDPEGTRLQLQSWLPKEMHTTINKTLVGFGQVICQPVGPRCDLCALGAARLCPSYRRVDPKSIASRVKIELLPDENETEVSNAAEAAIKIEGPEGVGEIHTKAEDVPSTIVKQEVKQEQLEW